MGNRKLFALNKLNHERESEVAQHRKHLQHAFNPHRSMLEVSHELVTSTTSNTPVPCHNNSITQPDKKTFTIHWPLVALFAAAGSSPE